MTESGFNNPLRIGFDIYIYTCRGYICAFTYAYYEYVYIIYIYQTTTHINACPAWLQESSPDLLPEFYMWGTRIQGAALPEALWVSWGDHGEPGNMGIPSGKLT